MEGKSIVGYGYGTAEARWVQNGTSTTIFVAFLPLSFALGPSDGSTLFHELLHLADPLGRTWFSFVTEVLVAMFTKV